MKSTLTFCFSVIVAAVSLGIVEQAKAQQPKSGLTDADRAYTLPDGVTTKDVTFYSEHTACYGKLFLPKGFSDAGSYPAVVLVGEWGVTSRDIEKYAAKIAGQGVVAMPIDYRGWGKSGAFVRLVEPVFTDDRLRFHPMTVKVNFKRGRLLPEAQIEDIRNAISYLQGEPGVNPQRVGLWASGESAGNAIAVAARDGRAKVCVLQVPNIPGKDTTPQATELKGPALDDAIRRARTGKSGDAITTFTGKKDLNAETRQALAEYHPFRLIGILPESVAILFVTAEKDEINKNEDHAIAASKALKGPTKVEELKGATHFAAYVGPAFDTGSTAAAEWFKEQLNKIAETPEGEGGRGGRGRGR